MLVWQIQICHGSVLIVCFFLLSVCICFDCWCFLYMCYRMQVEQYWPQMWACRWCPNQITLQTLPTCRPSLPSTLCWPIPFSSTSSPSTWWRRKRKRSARACLWWDCATQFSGEEAQRLRKHHCGVVVWLSQFNLCFFSWERTHWNRLIRTGQGCSSVAWTCTPLKQVCFPVEARDFSPGVNFQCRLSYSVCTACVCNRMHLCIC